MKLRIVKIGAAEIDEDTGLPLAQAVSEIDDSPSVGRFASFDKAPTFGSLGITALPYPATDAGFCEGLAAEDVSGLDAVLLGHRDSRSARIYGTLSPGDTVLHSTGPEAASQVILKEDGRVAAVITKDAAGHDIGFFIDPNGMTITGPGKSLFWAKKVGESSEVGFGNGFGQIYVGADGRFNANTPGGSLGAAAAAPAQGIAMGITGPINLISASWSVAARAAWRGLARLFPEWALELA